jgi:hypothetical protein
VLEDAALGAKQVDSDPRLVGEPLSAEPFINAGLRIDAFDFGETSEWMLDDFWFLNEPLDIDDQGHHLF